MSRKKSKRGSGSVGTDGHKGFSRDCLLSKEPGPTNPNLAIVQAHADALVAFAEAKHFNITTRDDSNAPKGSQDGENQENPFAQTPEVVSAALDALSVLTPDERRQLKGCLFILATNNCPPEYAAVRDLASQKLEKI
jgi:hypothetical protein